MKCKCENHVHGTFENEEHVHAFYGIVCSLISLAALVIGIFFRYREFAFWSLPGIELGWFLVAYLLVAWPVLREAWQSIRQKEFFNEFTLMSLASLGAFVIGEYPEGVAVMLFYAWGEMLQHAAVDRAKHHIQSLLDVRPEQAAVIRNGQLHFLDPAAVAVGEIIEVKAGERVPLDGILQEKQAFFDTSALTGESLPRTIQPGEEVLAGMIVSGQVVRLRVCRPYEQSALSRILALVQEASERKAPAELFIRRFARVYTPIVFLLALLIMILPALMSLLVPTFVYGWQEWVYRGLFFLVISCPCALMISIPLGYFGGIGAASRKGILFKGGNYLDAITRVNTVVFDKTGTLTNGYFEVFEVKAVNGCMSDLLKLVVSLESKSTHPIAQAIVAFASRQGITAVPVTDLCEYSGLGMEGTVDGKKVWIGNLHFLKSRSMAFPAELEKCVATVVACVVNGVYEGHLLLKDCLKPDAKEAIRRLKELHIPQIRLFSGDKQEIVAIFAKELGIDRVLAELLPQDKAACLEKVRLEEGANVAFVGDGMNDAPVLVLSDVGIAMGGLGSDAAIESADVVIQTDQPSKVATAIRIGRATRRIVWQNIIGALGVKLIILLAGIAGFITLWAAVFADVGVALLAVLNAVRLLTKKFE